jgi:hypothetical protein
MFEKIVLRRAQSGPALTMGDIAEGMLFYQNVHIILDQGALYGLIDTLGMRGLLDLLARKNVTAVYTEEMLCTRTNTVGGRQFHSFLAFTITGDKDSGHLDSRQQRLEQRLYKKGHARKEARRLAERFLTKVPVKKFSSDYFVAGGIPKAATGDLLQSSYVEAAMRQIARGTVGLETFADSVRVDVIPQQGAFELWTNIDFAAANTRRKMLDGGLGQLAEASLASAFLDASSDTVLAAHYGGEFYTSASSSDLVRLRYAELLKRAGISAAELAELKDVALPDYPSIRETINGSVRTFNEFLTVLDKSQKFREWIQGLNPDANVAAEYVRDITAEGWMGSIPAKLVRYVFGSAIGLAGLAPGLVAGAVDSFLVDRIAKGWRPSHFVDGKLKPFLGNQP